MVGKKACICNVQVFNLGWRNLSLFWVVASTRAVKQIISHFFPFAPYIYLRDIFLSQCTLLLNGGQKGKQSKVKRARYHHHQHHHHPSIFISPSSSSLFCACPFLYISISTSALFSSFAGPSFIHWIHRHRQYIQQNMNMLLFVAPTTYMHPAGRRKEESCSPDDVSLFTPISEFERISYLSPPLCSPFRPSFFFDSKRSLFPPERKKS